MKKQDHPLHFMLPEPKMSECRYSLRSGQNNTVLFENTTQMQNFKIRTLCFNCYVYSFIFVKNSFSNTR
jgi:hypothetical protein